MAMTFFQCTKNEIVTDGAVLSTLSMDRKAVMKGVIALGGNQQKGEVAHGGFITEKIAYGSTDDFSYLYGGGLCDNQQKPGAPEVLRENLKYSYVKNFQNEP